MAATLDLHRRDTIVALATAAGRGALAIVRLSGTGAFAVRDAIVAGEHPHTARHATRVDIVDDDGGLLDDALCTSFPGPRSFTGEDLVEFSLHGGRVVADLVLARCRRLGARAAAPGEFTLRAVLTGRLDLAAAEAVEAIVGAQTARAAKVAQQALRGALGEVLLPVRAGVVDVLAELEARLDYPDEPLGEANRDALVISLTNHAQVLLRHLQQASSGRRLMDGARVVLWGAPNAGKSTLLNALLGHERALVHHEPGTTRDVLEVPIEIAGIPVILVDVAGIRDGVDVGAVEGFGIARATAEVRRADVVAVLHPVDGAPAPPLPEDLLASAIVDVRTKVDLGSHENFPAPAGGAAGGTSPGLELSAKTGAGLDAFLAHLGTILVADADEVPLVQTARQADLLQAAGDAMHGAIDALKAAAPDEIVCSELRRAARNMDHLLGRDVGEDVLDLVFSRFCVGK